MQFLHEQPLNQPFETAVRIVQVDEKIARNDKAYLDVTVADKSGKMKFKMWDATPALFEQMNGANYLHIEGFVSLYQNDKQLNVKTFQAIRETDEAMLDMRLFYEHTPVDIEKAVRHIEETIDQLAEPYQSIVRPLYAEYEADFKRYPAAKSQHHAYIGGLLEHTESMLETAKFLAPKYQPLDASLVYASVILHDLCKIDEYEAMDGQDTSVEGVLINHINLMPMKIYHLAHTLLDMRDENVSARINALMHCILSHHGRPEWGAAVHPAMKEAELLHFIDNLDARMHTIEKELTKAGENTLTERIFTLDRRRMIRVNP